MDSCKKLDKNYVEGSIDGDVFCGLLGAVERVNAKVPCEQQLGDDVGCTVDQVDRKWLVLSRWVEEGAAKWLCESASVFDK